MYGDLARPPLDGSALSRALGADGFRVEVLASAGSTNALVAERARAGETHGLVVVAEEQTAGRGRLDRSWLSPPRAGLTFSVLLRPSGALGWVPLFGGLAVAQALRDHAEVDASLKWPNDVLIGGKKVAGLLAEAVDGAVVLGIGLNVTTRADELPHDSATSLALEGAAATDRQTLLKAILRALNGALGDRDVAAYRALCGTLGRTVRLELPGNEAVEGVAEAVDDQGRLVINGVAFAAGDVVHLR
ncbi:MAG: biotin/acetyl-CoA-carboxylase ligase [Frankiales bacterium]|nr:biotin/acetyl-CoA-carboxylase ligase [Frankiales bacterium]